MNGWRGTRGAATGCGLALWPLKTVSPLRSAWFWGMGVGAAVAGAARTAATRALRSGAASFMCKFVSARALAGTDLEPHAGHLLGYLPQAPGHVLVARGAARRDRLGVAALLEQAVGPDVGPAGQAGFGRGVERRQRAHLLALGDHEVAHPHHQLVDQRRAGELQVRGGVAGMGGHALDVRSPRTQAPIELEGEQQVGELRLAVGAPAEVAALVAEVVGAELKLEAVGGPAPRRRHHPRVVDQQVEPVVPAAVALGEGANRVEAGQVELLQLQSRARGG